ncbi:hypothetical protein D3C78_1316940 [compost metagenome]
MHVQQAQRTGHQHAVDVRIDLGEVGGLERHGDAEVGQAVSQLLDFGIHQLHGVRALGLQPPLHILRGRKRTQLLLVAFGQGLHMAQHQRRDVIAAGDFDLRNGLARIHGGDQRAQRHQHVVDMRRQHAADFHVGDVAALALMKAD